MIPRGIRHVIPFLLLLLSLLPLPSQSSSFTEPRLSVMETDFPLAFTARLEVYNSDSMSSGIEFVWARTDGEGPTLVLTGARSQSTTINTTVFNGTLFRLAPGHEYRVSAREVANTSVITTTTAMSGLTYLQGLDGKSLDESPLCEVSGEVSFDMLVLDHPSNGTVVVACDWTGWLVWFMAPQTTNSSWSTWGVVSQLPGETYNVLTIINDNSPGGEQKLGIFTPAGNLVDFVTPKCDVADGASLTHECIAPEEDLGAVWQSVVRNVEGRAQPQAGAVVGVWNRSSNTVITMVDPFRLLDPAIQRGNMSDIAVEYPVFCGVNVSDSQDWLHGNAISKDNDSWILGLRHLSAVASVGVTDDGDAILEWFVSGEAAVNGSNFSFQNDTHRFYNIHGARIPRNPVGAGNLGLRGNEVKHILVFDNGDSRPASEGGQYSRGLEVELDFERGTATAVWSFAPAEPHFSKHAGFVSELKNGNRLVAFSCDSPPWSETCWIAMHEADRKGVEVGRTVVPLTPSVYTGWPGGYRAVVWESIAGESIAGERGAATDLTR